MSLVLSIKQLCERALRKIGAFSINDAAADGDELQEAQFWLDLVVGHAGGTAKPLWLVPATISAVLPIGINSLDLATLFGTQYPAGGVQFVIDAYIRTFQSAQPWAALTTYPAGAQVEPTVANGFFYQTAAGGKSAATEPTWPSSITGTVADGSILWAEAGTTTGRDEPVEIVTRGEYDELDNKLLTGRPQRLYVDRLTTPTAYWHPMVDPNAGTSYELHLTTQTFAPDLTGNAAGVPAMRQAWQLWLVTALAAEIGSGPVRMLDDAETRNMRAAAATFWVQLMGNENQEVVRPRRSAYSDLG